MARDAPLVIVGAGLVGSALALTLARANPTLAITLVDPAGWRGEAHLASGFDPRVVALNSRSVGFLAEHELWQRVLAARACPYRNMVVWDGEGTGRITFSARELHLAELGYIVENSVLLGEMHRSLAALRNITLVPAALTQLQQVTGRYRLDLDHGEQLDAELVVGADGAGSLVRTLAGVRTRAWSYGQSAIITTVGTSQPHQATAWQRFTEAGPLAFLPLAGEDQRRCSIVWSLTHDAAMAVAAQRDREFCQGLTRAFEATLGEVTSADSRHCVPLTQMHAVRYCKLGLALVGDAAHTIHPLAGQGVNLGLRDVAVLAEEITRARARDVPLTEPATLRRYERRVQAHNLAVMAAMEGFKWTFSQRPPLVRLARNWGMSGVGGLPMLKRELIKLAAGDRF